MATPESTTTRDNNRSASSRTVPNAAREFTLNPNVSTVSVVLPEDVKTAVIYVTGADVEYWPSFTDGVNDHLAGITVDNSIQSSPSESNITNSYANADAEKTVKNIPDGFTYEEAQEREFNKINVKSAGSATVRVYPGYGFKNEVFTP